MFFFPQYSLLMLTTRSVKMKTSWANFELNLSCKHNLRSIGDPLNVTTLPSKHNNSNKCSKNHTEPARSGMVEIWSRSSHWTRQVATPHFYPVWRKNQNRSVCICRPVYVFCPVLIAFTRVYLDCVYTLPGTLNVDPLGLFLLSTIAAATSCVRLGTSTTTPSSLQCRRQRHLPLLGRKVRASILIFYLIWYILFYLRTNL